MRIVVTGTPGTGKTSATEQLDTDLEVIHLNDVIHREGLDEGVDEDRDSVLADFEAIEEWLAGRDDVVAESHLAHHFDADRVVVLRAHPETIETRLADREESEASIAENAESEALDVILTEAVEAHGIDSVYEIDTTDRSIEEVSDEIAAVIDGEREPSAGTVSFVDWL